MWKSSSIDFVKYSAIRLKELKYFLEGYRAIGDTLRVYSVPVHRITHGKKSDPDYFGGFGIVDGDWDKNVVLWENKSMFDMFCEHFNKGVEWEKTERFKEMVSRLEHNGSITVLDCPPEEQSKELYLEYLYYMDELYESIKKGGYKSQKQLSAEADFFDRGFSHPALNEIQVYIGRDGDFISYSGQHRICLAKILNLNKIPVRTRLRHADWQMKREAIKSKRAICSDKNENITKYLSHPEVQDLL